MVIPKRLQHGVKLMEVLLQLGRQYHYLQDWMLRLVFPHIISPASGIYFSVRRESVLTSFPFWMKVTFILRFHSDTDTVITVRVILLCLKYTSVMKTAVFLLKAQQVQHDNGTENSRG